MEINELRVSFFLPDFSAGGTEQVVIQVANAASKKGVRVDLVVSQAKGQFRNRVAESVRIVDLRSRGKYTSLFALAKYLRRTRPKVLYSALNGANLLAVLASKLGGVGTNVVVSMHNHLDAKLKRRPSVLDGIRKRVIRFGFMRATHAVAVSESIRGFLIDVWHLPEDRVSMVPNPVDWGSVERAKQIHPHHPFFDSDVPVVVAVGRLSKQKNFKLLVEAVALASRRRDMRLLIAGEGKCRKELEELVETLGISEIVDLIGFVEDPLSWMNLAAVFALSSDWEGSPLVLIEAMALGKRIVSTDCESGPSELLENYPSGLLSEVGNASLFAAKLVEAFDLPESEFDPRKILAERESCLVSEKYLKLVGLAEQ